MVIQRAVNYNSKLVKLCLLLIIMEREKAEKIIIELSGKANGQLKELKEELKAKSKEEVIHSALKLMNNLNDEIRSGSEIIIKNKKKKTVKRLTLSGAGLIANDESKN